MESLKVILIDDEQHARSNLNYLLEKYCPEIKVVGMAETSLEAKKMIYSLKPDAIFLDILLPDINAFEFLESICEKEFFVIIVSAHSEYGIQALRANVVDYLLKPVSIKELQLAVQRLFILKEKNNKNNDIDELSKIFISGSHGFSILEISEIIRLEGENNYTKFYLWNKKPLIVTKTLKEFESVLPESKFIRVHKSDIINISYISEYSNLDGGSVKMKCGSRISISRRRLSTFIEKVKELTNSVK